MTYTYLPTLSSFLTTINMIKLSCKWIPLKFSNICQSVVKRVNNVNFLSWIDLFIMQQVSEDKFIFRVIDN